MSTVSGFTPEQFDHLMDIARQARAPRQAGGRQYIVLQANGESVLGEKQQNLADLAQKIKALLQSSAGQPLSFEDKVALKKTVDWLVQGVDAAKSRLGWKKYFARASQGQSAMRALQKQLTAEVSREKEGARETLTAKLNAMLIRTAGALGVTLEAGEDGALLQRVRPRAVSADGGGPEATTRPATLTEGWAQGVVRGYQLQDPNNIESINQLRTALTDQAQELLKLDEASTEDSFNYYGGAGHYSKTSVAKTLLAGGLRQLLSAVNAKAESLQARLEDNRPAAGDAPARLAEKEQAWAQLQQELNDLQTAQRELAKSTFFLEQNPPPLEPAAHRPAAHRPAAPPPVPPPAAAPVEGGEEEGEGVPPPPVVEGGAAPVPVEGAEAAEPPAAEPPPPPSIRDQITALGARLTEAATLKNTVRDQLKDAFTQAIQDQRTQVLRAAGIEEDDVPDNFTPADQSIERLGGLRVAIAEARRAYEEELQPLSQRIANDYSGNERATAMQAQQEALTQLGAQLTALEEGLKRGSMQVSKSKQG